LKKLDKTKPIPQTENTNCVTRFVLLATLKKRFFTRIMNVFCAALKIEQKTVLKKCDDYFLKE
jgi:hypothetical protein